MEYIVEKIGMSRTINAPSIPVTLLKLVPTKVCALGNEGKAIVAYSYTKAANKAIAGQQAKYGLSKEFNSFATLCVSNTQAVGDIEITALKDAKILKVSFNTKGRGFQGVIKRHGFSGGPKSHGSRFHRRPGSIGNCEWPGRVQPGRKMSGHYGNEKTTVKNEIISFDEANGILVLKGSVPGFNGAMGRIKVVK